MSIAKQTEQFIDLQPFLKNALKRKLINYSALTRLILTELNLKTADHEAVLIAIRRYVEKIKLAKDHEKQILRVLQESHIETKNKICIIVLSKKVPLEKLLSFSKQASDKNLVFHLIEGSHTFTIVTHSSIFKSLIQ
ncbi:MAG: hypothetical protein Q7S92_07025, partial [Candidatus Diapherotrites archaeon]|nr:hypothetical protein [Candidatus Diapherotrites archaeon]